MLHRIGFRSGGSKNRDGGMRRTNRAHSAAFGAALLAGFFLIAPPAFAANIGGTACPAFPADNWWHADVSKLPVHPSSAAWMSHMGAAAKLHPDFGPSFGEIPVPYGMPITVVGGAHPKVTVGFDYPTQSDNVPYPLGADTKPEGGQ